jgi:MFS transporter, DHA1 family, multidrug resistance protein
MLNLQKTKSEPIALQRSKDGYVLVDWYTTDDPENPQNWSNGKKRLVLTQIWYIAPMLVAMAMTD